MKYVHCSPTDTLEPQARREPGFQRAAFALVACFLIASCSSDDLFPATTTPVSTSDSSGLSAPSSTAISSPPTDSLTDSRTDSHTDTSSSTSPSTSNDIWTTPLRDWPGALLSVAGTSDDDVWVVGAAVADEATLLHWNGATWHTISTGFEEDFWWVHALDEGEALVGGSLGAVFHIDGDDVRRMDTPALARHTVYGVWGTSADDFYAVGGIGARGGFIWRYNASGWQSLALPEDTPRREHGDTEAILKAWGDGDGYITFVGGGGAIYELVDDGPLTLSHRVDADTLFTVTGDAASGRRVAVGGGAACVVADPTSRELLYEAAEPSLLQGIALDSDNRAWASGAFGTLLRESDAGDWEEIPHGLDLLVESLHAVWVSPAGNVWTVGGNVLSSNMDDGVLVHGRLADADWQGTTPPALAAPEVDGVPDACPDDELGAVRGGTIARRWNEATLQAIRRSLPEPTVHARNLYHVSLAIHEAWAAFEEGRVSLLHEEDATHWGEDEREQVLSHAAYRLLEHRYAHRTGGELTSLCLWEFMEELGLDPAFDDLHGDTPEAMGNRIGQAVIDYFAEDNSLEHIDYQDPTYHPSNPPLFVDDPGIDVLDPSTWQALNIARAVTQNGIPEPSGPVGYIGPHWGGVTPFANRRPAVGDTYFELGERPTVDSPEIADWVVDVIEKTAGLDPTDGVMMDASPGSYGNNTVGVDDGEGHPQNPATGEPYEEQLVPRGDFMRVLAEFWADGPASETPPGHWNVVAHQAFDHPDFVHRFYGEGPVVDRLEWDVQALLILNGALHDAAIVAWEAKREYETSRPITLVRWMGAQGQRSDPDAPSHDPDGLPLIEGLIEVITEQSAAPGERHAHLDAFIGEIAIFTWPGEPGDREGARSEMRWVRAVEWMPYQPRTFVSPAFPGYVSGHSTFSHAAARVLHRMTGTPYFPGGMGEFVARENEYLEFELGPSEDVRLQWATWYDAADQAGQSRIWGGIHITPDDYDGRLLGNQTGDVAADWGARHIAGFAPRPTIGDPSNPLHGGNPLDDLEEEPGGPPTGDEELTVGAGRTSWDEVLQGQSIRWEAGQQGGFHIWGAVQLRPDFVSSLEDGALDSLAATARIRNSDGQQIGSATRTGAWQLQDDGSATTSGLLVILQSGLHPMSFAGELMELEAEVEWEDRTLRSAVSFVSTCCD